MLERSLRRYEEGMGVGGLAPVRAFLVSMVLCWGLWLGLLAYAGSGTDYLVAYFLRVASPWVVFDAFLPALCLVPLAARLPPKGVVALYVLAATAWPLLAFWGAHPYEAGVVAGAEHLPWLAAVPVLAFGGVMGFLGNREGAAGGGDPAGPAYAVAATAAAVLCIAGLAFSLVLRGGQFGLGYTAVSLALLAGAAKMTAIKGVAAGLALRVLTRGLRGVPAVAMFAVAAAAVGIPPALSGRAGAAEAGIAWAAGLAAYAVAAAGSAIPAPGKRRRRDVSPTALDPAVAVR